MNSTQNLPFAMTTESVSAWLGQVSKLDTVPASHELYSVLKKINRSQPETKDLSCILDQLTPTVLHLTGNLNALLLPAINKQGVMPKKSRKLARLCAQLIRSHCLAYCQLVDDQSLAESPRVQALYTALQLIGFSFKTHASISERPSTTLWKKMGEIHQMAFDCGIANNPVTHKISLFKNQKTIASVLKRNLVYFLFDLYRIPSEQLVKYCEIAERCADQLAFAENSNTAFNFYWDTTGSQLPQRGNPPKIEAKNLIFNTEAITQYLREHMPECDRRDPVFSALWQKLTGYWEIIDSVIPTKPILYHLDTGWPATLERLRYRERMFKIHRLSAQAPEQNALRTLELVPLEHEKLGHQTRWEETAQLRTNNLKSGVAYLLPARTPHYFLTQVRIESLPHNLPVLLYTQQEPPKFGIIRFIQLKRESDNQNMLIETLPGKPYLISVTIQSLVTEAVLIKQHSGAETLVLAPGKYTTGDSICRSDRPDDICYLSRLIEANDQFMYYQLASD